MIRRDSGDTSSNTDSHCFMYEVLSIHLDDILEPLSFPGQLFITVVSYILNAHFFER